MDSNTAYVIVAGSAVPATAAAAVLEPLAPLTSAGPGHQLTPAGPSAGPGHVAVTSELDPPCVCERSAAHKLYERLREPAGSVGSTPVLTAAVVPPGREAYVETLRAGMTARAQEILEELRCPISWEAMVDPVFTADGDLPYHKPEP